MPIVWVGVTIFFITVAPIGIYAMQLDIKKAGVKRDTQTNAEFGMWPRKYWIERIDDLKNRQFLAFCIIFYIVLTIATFHGEIYQAILHAFQTIW